MPQFIMGVISGFLRLKIGIIWSIFLHRLHNFISITLVIIPEIFFPNKYTVDSKGFTIVTSKNIIRIDDKSSISTSFDSFHCSNLDLKTIMTFLLSDENKKQVIINNHALKNIRFNIEYIEKLNQLNKNMLLSQIQEIYDFTITKKM